MKVYRCPSDADSSDVNENSLNYGKSNYIFSSLAGQKRRLEADIPDGTSNTIMVGERDNVRGIGGVWAVRPSNSSTGILGVAVWQPNKQYSGTRGAACCSEGSGLADQCARLGFTSGHDGGSNFALADGSVRMFRSSIESDPAAWGASSSGSCNPVPTNFLYQKLYSPDDGLVVGDLDR